MTSERQARANRANARRSTGPTSARGKTRAAQNARRHGLSQDILANPELAGEVEHLAQRLVDEADRPDLIDLGRRIAAAQIDVQRIRLFRQRRMHEAVLGFVGGGREGPWRPAVLGSNELAAALVPLAMELKAVDRYARRAWSRRKFAIRDFVAAQRGDGGGLLRTWAAVHPRPQRRPQAWRAKFPRCAGEARRQLEWIRQQRATILEQLAAAEARAATPSAGAGL